MKCRNIKTLVAVALFFSMHVPLAEAAVASSIPVNFNPPITYGGLNSASQVVSKDFNGDGNLDLAIAGADGILILFGNGDGSFQPPTSIEAGAFLVLRSADFNLDGKPDLAAISSARPDAASVLLNSGYGTFQARVDYPSGGTGVNDLVTGDFNHDGIIDLAVANYGSNLAFFPQTNCNVAVLLGHGNGTFGTAFATQLSTTKTAHPIALTPFKLGNPVFFDLAAATYDSALLLFVPRGIYMAPLPIITSEMEIAELYATDVNRDGLDDFVTVDPNGNQSIRVQGATGDFMPPLYHAGGSNLLLNDLNGDGILDLAGTSNNLILISLGKGDGTFSVPVPFSAGGSFNKMVAGDFDGNGRPDLAVASAETNSISIFLNRTIDMATPASASFTGIPVYTISVPQIFTLSNSTVNPLAVASMIIAGVDSGMFNIAPGGESPCASLTPTLAPGVGCTMQVVFRPSTLGNKTADLIITSNHPITPMVSIPLSGSANPYSLWINWMGTNPGTVQTLPLPSTVYSSGPQRLFIDSETVTLQANPGPDSSFGGWAGCDSVDGNQCTITMSTVDNRIVSVKFNPIMPIGIKGTMMTTFTTMMDAYNGAESGDVVQTVVASFSENLTFSRSISVTLQGGYDAGFNTRIGKSTVVGDLTVDNGTATVEDLEIHGMVNIGNNGILIAGNITVS